MAVAKYKVRRLHPFPTWCCGFFQFRFLGFSQLSSLPIFFSLRLSSLLRSLMADLGGTLPETMMMEILLRVPPESLARFKSVSKSWYALINHPKFHGSLQNLNVLLKRIVINNETGNREIRFSFLKYPLAPDDDVVIEDVHFPSLPFCVEFPHAHIRGHSHGLVCLFGNIYNVFLYNPVTRELHKLPPSILFSCPNSYAGCLGFGYDTKSRDFKVVRIVQFVPPGTNLLLLNGSDVEFPYHPSRAEVYDLKKGEWREIETPVPGRVSWSTTFETNYEGFYYWWAKSEELGKPEFILSFDMSEEVFGRIPLPESFQKCHGRVRSMGFLNGSILLLHYPRDNGDDERSFDIWEMVKLGSGVVSWSKLFTIGRVDPVSLVYQTPLSFVGSDQLLIETFDFGSRKGQLVLYDIKTKHLKHLTLEGIPDTSQAIVFVKTLLSVKGHNHNLNLN